MKKQQDDLLERLTKFEHNMPSDPCTVEECREVLRQCAEFWLEMKDNDDVTDGEANMFFRVLAALGGSILSCMFSGGVVTIDVERIDR